VENHAEKRDGNSQKEGTFERDSVDKETSSVEEGEKENSVGRSETKSAKESVKAGEENSLEQKETKSAKESANAGEEESVGQKEEKIKNLDNMIKKNPRLTLNAGEIYTKAINFTQIDNSTNYNTFNVSAPSYPRKKLVKNVSNKKMTKSNVNNHQNPKKKTVKLTNEYIMTLEDYLDSQDVQKRLKAAKDLVERVQEDKSRKNNVALTALTNKMLRDPYQPIKFMALGILDDRMITGNNETVSILRKIEKGRYSKNGNADEDAIKAAGILL